ncbi:hypothetical protein CSOJ01_09913 [Colletotrichum sojae]|uniref:Uncharacterized protein n=1 Tax=Colletotrichum sojae TaxID=2175907 RepID=A0A8H6J1N4_9PEZI|nr:hypothetical protein CSOJ01_09913 [Colletotrichum sojae]
MRYHELLSRRRSRTAALLVTFAAGVIVIVVKFGLVVVDQPVFVFELFRFQLHEAGLIGLGRLRDAFFIRVRKDE